MASGNMKIGIITECIQQLIIKLLNVLCLGPCLLLSTMHSVRHKWLDLDSYSANENHFLAGQQVK